MSLGIYDPPKVFNEPILKYRKDSKERGLLKEELAKQMNNPIEVPVIIGGEKIFTEDTAPLKSPSDHSLNLGNFHMAGSSHINEAISRSLDTAKDWAQMPYEQRIAIFLRAADLISEKYRYKLNAATMLGQGKTVHQAEIDSACELIDFLRFNVFYMTQIYREQPPVNTKGVWNQLEYRPLEGFIYAITPFNFTAIAGNLPIAPAMLGNVVVWKPASTAVLSAYYIMEILEEAGLPPGVINMVPGNASKISEIILNQRDLAGVHFTGSTPVFNNFWKIIGENISKNLYKSYPRIVGETGGKDFLVAYKDTDLDHLAINIVRGAFEYQGQKCSALSRAYIPKSIWDNLRSKLEVILEDLKMGNITDFNNFMGAVIDEKSYNKIANYIERAKYSSEADVIMGGEYDKSTGWFIRPTIILCKNPKYETMAQEIFGPVLSIYIYEDDNLDETLTLIDESTEYALTGAVFAKDRYIINKISTRLKNAAGNFYINDKPTGAVVGQQPFGGSRGSGTNDKAGSHLNLHRWLNVRTIKDNYIFPESYRYPHME